MEGIEGYQVNRTGSWFEFIALMFYLPEIVFGHPESLIKIILKK